MRTELLIILGFTILVVVSAPKPKKTEKGVEKSPPKPKSSPPAKKPTKKAVKEEVDEIPEDLDDILQDDEESEDEVEIPTVDELTVESDPIELGRRIKSVTDKKERRALVAELKKAWNKNKGTFPGKFYQAAYASLASSKKAPKLAQEFWNKELQKAVQNAANAGKDIADGTKSGLGDVLGKVGLGDALGNARKIAQINPVGIALRRGESALLSSLSDGLKNVGKVSDFAHDATINTSKLIRAATFPVDNIPILSDIKNNVHDYIEEVAERGKYLTGTFAENGSTAYARAASNADRKAQEKEDLLRQFSTSRKLN